MGPKHWGEKQDHQRKDSDKPPKVQYVPAIKVPTLLMSTCFGRGEILRNVIVRGKAGQQSENKTRTGLGMAECFPGVWKTLDCLRNKTNKK